MAPGGEGLPRETLHSAFDDTGKIELRIRELYDSDDNLAAASTEKHATFDWGEKIVSRSQRTDPDEETAVLTSQYLFYGSKGGGDATGILLSLVQTCRAMDIEPFAYIEDVLRRINGPPAHRLDELLPGNWHKAESHY